MPLRSVNQGRTQEFRVLIQNPSGKFLAGDATDWFFTDDRSAARIFNYAADHVAEQLELIRRTHGLLLEAVPVPALEIYEMCDRCKEFFMPFMIFFDGKKFLCADCLPRPSRPRPNRKA